MISERSWQEKIKARKKKNERGIASAGMQDATVSAWCEERHYCQRMHNVRVEVKRNGRKEDTETEKERERAGLTVCRFFNVHAGEKDEESQSRNG